MAQQEQIAAIDNEVDLLRTEMKDRFDYVEDKLELLHQQELIKRRLDLLLREVRDLKSHKSNSGSKSGRWS